MSVRVDTEQRHVGIERGLPEVAREQGAKVEGPGLESEHQRTRHAQFEERQYRGTQAQ